MKKKILSTLLALTLSSSMLCSTASAITMYAPDGRTANVLLQDIAGWKAVGWYEHPLKIWGYNCCWECGKKIAMDRLYCNTCLGYGKCHKCGKSIESDKLYCSTCLGYGKCQDCGKNIDSDQLYCSVCLSK